MDYLERLPRPSKQGVNQGLSSPSSEFMDSLLGEPRDSYTGDCQNPNIQAFKKLVTTRSVGPFRATGLKVALDSLERVLADVARDLPDLHAKLGTAGMLCCRFKRLGGGRLGTTPSNHSWGAAIDITIDGKLDPQGDNMTFRGLQILSKYFNAHGWYWGAVFPTEDSMHFEVARETLLKWRDAGLV